MTDDSTVPDYHIAPLVQGDDWRLQVPIDWTDLDVETVSQLKKNACVCLGDLCGHSDCRELQARLELGCTRLKALVFQLTRYQLGPHTMVMGNEWRHEYLPRVVEN